MNNDSMTLLVSKKKRKYNNLRQASPQPTQKHQQTMRSANFANKKSSMDSMKTYARDTRQMDEIVKSQTRDKEKTIALQRVVSDNKDVDFEKLSQQFYRPSDKQSSVKDNYEVKAIRNEVQMNLTPLMKQANLPRNSLFDNISINELSSGALPRRRIDSELQQQFNSQDQLHVNHKDPKLNLHMNSRLSSMSPTNSNQQHADFTVGNSPSRRRRSTFANGGGIIQSSGPVGTSGVGGIDSNNQQQFTNSSSKSNQNQTRESRKQSVVETKPKGCCDRCKDFITRVSSSTPYLMLNVFSTCLATLLDLIRVGFFDSSVDFGFFVIMMILQVILFFQIMGKFITLGWRQHLFDKNNIAEIIFFLDNFFSTYLVSEYNFYLVANYLKIVNVLRIGSIVMYLKKRQKQQLIEKFKKEREKLKKFQEKQMQSFTKSKRGVQQQNSLRPQSPTKRGEVIREKFSYSPDRHEHHNSNAQTSQRASTQQRNSDASKHSNEQNVILQERFKDNSGQSLDLMQHSNLKLENTYTELILRRTMTIFFLCVITVPFFLNTFYFSPHETLDEFNWTLQKSLIATNYTKMSQQQLVRRLESFVNISKDIVETPIIEFVSPYYNYSIMNELNLRSNEVYIFETQVDPDKIFPIRMVFTRRDYNSLYAILGMCAYIWYFILILVMIIVINKDIEKQVLNPFNALFEKIWSLIIDPMLVVNNQFQQIAGMYSMLQNKQKKSKDYNSLNQNDMSTNDPSFTNNNPRRSSVYPNQKKAKDSENFQDNIDNEIELIDKSLFKISKLLMLYYGEAGASLVSKMIRSESSLLDFSEELGTKTLAIFGFCDIRNFTDATEILQEGVVSLVNKVAYIVHSNTIRYGGQPNKNIGDAFLLVWKLSSSKETYKALKPLAKLNSAKEIPSSVKKEVSIIADLALLTVLKTISQINTAKELQCYNDNLEMHKRIPGFKIKMGFGLHLGWAIEGMIGSNFKIDASYLSPNVNTASRLEAATKQYGVQLLFSQGIFSLLSAPFQELARIVDKAILKGCQSSQDLYTVDMDLNQGETALLNVAGIGIGMTPRLQDSMHSTRANQFKHATQEEIRNEQRCIFDCLFREELTTESMLAKCQEAQEIIIKSPFFRIFKLQYLQAFRLYIDGFWYFLSTQNLTILIQKKLIGKATEFLKTNDPQSDLFLISQFKQSLKLQTIKNSFNMDQQAQNIPSIVEEKVTKSNGDTIIKKYLKGKFLGKGGFAKCYEFTNQETGAICAAKVVVKASLTKSRAKQKLMSEIKIHRSIRHQHVVQFQHFFEDSENVYILLELCHNQSMNELLRRRKRLHELEVLCYASQIINALKYLHAHRIIHRDLKLGNLFLNDKMEIKLGDFGLASKLDFDGEKKRTICGTPNYIAPEVLEGQSGHSYEVDVWSLGVIIYTLIIGKPPFETQDVKTTYKRIRMNAYTFPDHVQISDAAKDLISKILIGDPSSRPTLDEILCHDFFTQCQIPKTLPPSFLACPPSSQYLKQFMPQGSSYQTTQSSLQQRLESTAPANIAIQSNGFQSTGPASTGNRPSIQSQVPMSDRGVLSRKAVPQQNERQIASSQQRQEIVQQQFFSPSLSSLPVQNQRVLSPSSHIPNQAVQVKEPSIWVKQWVDYSSKYGMGYILNNQATGVFFNDSTKIVMDINGKNFYYFERKAVTSTEKQDVMSTFLLTEYPKELQKKVTLLQHFRSYLENQTPAGGNTENQRDVPMRDETGKASSAHVYVKKWMRTKHAIMFRLSNKIVQVIFQDSTQILLNSESRVVTYVNKKEDRINLPLNQALESNNPEMTKRLKYTKDILTHMLSNNGPSQQQPINSAHTRRQGDLPSDMRTGSNVQTAQSNRRPFTGGVN